MNIYSDVKKQKIIRIGNNDRVILNLKQPEQYEIVYFSQNLNFLEVVKQITENHSDVALFVVDIDYECELPKKEITPYPGILLLKYLRLHKCFSHFCLIGGDIEKVLKERPGDFIVTSEGVSVINPKNTECLSNVEQIIREKFNDDHIRTYFKHEDNLVRNRHHYSNIWGVLQLYKVHRIIESPNESNTKDFFSEVSKISELQESLKFFKSYQGLVMRLLYDINDLTIQGGVKYLNKKIEYQNLESETWEQLEEIAVQKEAELAKLESSQQQEIVNFCEQTRLNGLIKKIWDFFRGKDEKVLEFIERTLQEKEQLKDLISHIRGKIEILKKRKSHQVEILNVFNHSNIDEKSSIDKKSSGYMTTIQKLHKVAPSVLLIDDKAKEGGWGYIYQLMIYGRERPDKFHTYQPNKNESIEDMVGGIKNIIARNSIDVILLDIRLRDERNDIEDIDNVSGIALLKKLKKDWLSIPIIVTTASKQKKYHSSCLKNKAIYFWTKPGIEDANWSGKELVLNYYSLIRTIKIIIETPIIKFIYKDFIPLMKEFKRAYDLNYMIKGESFLLSGMPKEDTKNTKNTKNIKNIKNIIDVSFSVMFEKLQSSLQEDNEFINFPNINMSLPLFLLSFCFEKNVNFAYEKMVKEKGGNYEEEKKRSLSQKLLNIVHDDLKACISNDEKYLPEQLFRLNLIRNNNTHESFSKVEDLRYYTLLFFNSLYCKIQDIGEGCERILMKGKITKKEEKYCCIVETDTGKEVIINREQNSDKIDKIEDKKEYIFVLERQIKLFDSEKDDPIFKVGSKYIEEKQEKSSKMIDGEKKEQGISDERVPKFFPYIQDLNFHRIFFFLKNNLSNETLENNSSDNIIDYNLHITYTIIHYFKEKKLKTTSV